MARKASDRLTTLLRLAALREERAARQLGAAAQQHLNEEQRRQQLADYEREYQRSYLDKGREQLLSRAQLLNYRGFFNQLDQIQQHQARVVAERGAELERARAGWLAQYAKRRLLTQVRDRARRQEEQQLEQRLQRELDDRPRR
jgi:flagellar export protein FliJ